jgi:hypothetical protein
MTFGHQPADQSAPSTAVKQDAQPGVVAVSYDETKDKSNVGFVDLKVFADSEVSITLNLGCGYKGRKPVDPGQCFVSLTARSRSQQFHEHDTPFKAVADDKVVIEKPFSSFGYQREADYFIEPIISLWRLPEIRSLAKAKAVVFILGSRKITLSDQELQVIREVSNHFTGCCGA